MQKRKIQPWIWWWNANFWHGDNASPHTCLNHNWWIVLTLGFSQLFFLRVARVGRPMRCVRQGLELMIRQNSQRGQSSMKLDYVAYSGVVISCAFFLFKPQYRRRRGWGRGREEGINATLPSHCIAATRLQTSCIYEDHLSRRCYDVLI